MSTAVLPSLVGLGFDVVRTPIWSINIQTSVSGKDTAIGYWSYPKWQWELTYDVLRSDLNEFQDLAGFFNSRQGRFDTFLYQDAEDNAASHQIGTGDGTTTAFQLVREFGGFIEPILAPNVVNHIYLDGVDQADGWTVSPWGSSSPGVVTFDTAPDSGAVVSADFSFYFPCRFNEDQLSFNNFLKMTWNAQSVAFTSVK